MSHANHEVKMRIRSQSRTMDHMRCWWLAYVTGFDIDRHCQDCLLGTKQQRNRKVRREMDATGRTEYTLDEAGYDYLYLCGVSWQGWANNFHLAMEHAPGERIEKRSPDGRFVVLVENAREIEIQPLPDGYGGYPRQFTTCRNWQFGVQQYTDVDLGVQPIDPFRCSSRSKPKPKPAADPRTRMLF